MEWFPCKGDFKSSARTKSFRLGAYFWKRTPPKYIYWASGKIFMLFGVLLDSNIFLSILRKLFLDFDYASPNGKNIIMRISYFDALSYSSTVFYFDIIFSSSPIQRMLYLIISKLQRLHQKKSKSGGSYFLSGCPCYKI